MWQILLQVYFLLYFETLRNPTLFIYLLIFVCFFPSKLLDDCHTAGLHMYPHVKVYLYVGFHTGC